MKLLTTLIFTVLTLFVACGCSDTADVNSANQHNEVSRTESMLTSDMCGQTPRQVEYHGNKNQTIKVGEQKDLDFWTFPHHTYCGDYKYIIEDESVLIIP